MTSRIGLAGLILIASLVIFAFLAGGVVVHRLETTPTASGQQQEQSGEQGQGPSEDSNEADDAEND